MNIDPIPSCPPRITLRSMLDQLMLHLNLEKGMLYTLWALLVNPGKAIRYYLMEDRRKLVKPLGFVFLLVGLSTYLMVYALEDNVLKDVEIGLEKELSAKLKLDVERKVAQRLNSIIIEYRNLLQLSGIPLLGLISFLFFRKENLNYAEHLVLGCYVIGYVSWFSVLGALLFILFGEINFLIILAVLSFFYQIYFYWSVFNKSWNSLLKSIGLYAIYLMTFGMLVIGLMVLAVNILF